MALEPTGRFEVASTGGGSYVSVDVVGSVSRSQRSSDGVLEKIFELMTLIHANAARSMLLQKNLFDTKMIVPIMAQLKCDKWRVEY